MLGDDCQRKYRKRDLGKIVAIAGLILILSVAANHVYAQQANWLSVSIVRDLTGNVLVQAGQPILAGHSYNVTMTINVPFSQSSFYFNISLDSAMASSGPQFWYILSNSYSGYDPAIFVPGSRTVTFRQMEGNLVLSAIFSVPSEITVSKLEGITLRFSKDDFQLIAITVTGGSMVGKAVFRISDSAIETYLATYSEKTNLIPAGKIDKAYSTLVNDIVQQSQALYKLGLPEKATDMLNIIDPASLPAPPNTTFVTLLTAGVVALAAIAALLGVINLRGRSKHGFTLEIISDVQRELAGLEVTASRYDSNLAEQLKRLRDKLSEGT